MSKRHIVCTLDIDYPEVVTNITLSSMKEYSKNIGAEFLILSDRKFPNLPITQEKFQLYDLDADHITFMDVDALINPAAPDFSKIAPDEIVIAEILDASDFSYDSIPGREKFRIHSAFLSFARENRFVVEPSVNPLQFTEFILGENKECHLDEFIMSLNVLKRGADLIDLNTHFTNSIAHLGGSNITIDKKVEFLKK